MIEVRHHPEHDLVVHTVTGPLTEEAFVEAGRAMYSLDPPPTRSFWDFTDADLTHFSMDRIRSVQSALEGPARARTSGRTAAVAPGDLGYATVRQYIAFSDTLGLPFEQRVFRTPEAAWEWLGVDPSELEP